MPYDAPTWDMTAVLYAVRPEADTLAIRAGYDQRAQRWQHEILSLSRGKHRYLILDPAQKENIVKPTQKSRQTRAPAAPAPPAAARTRAEAATTETAGTPDPKEAPTR
jgi:hypothetical protein